MYNCIEVIEMKKLLVVFLTVSLLLTLVFPVFALTKENDGKEIFIKVDGQADDTIGKVLIYQVKELIRNSKKFTLVDLTADSEEDAFTIQILTLAKNEKDNFTIYSVTWLQEIPKVPYSLHLNHVVGFCGSRRVKEVASGIVATTDETIEKYLNKIRNVIYDEHKNP